jgi:hypothetical protein
MNPEIKKKWIEALRSGEYKQGKGYLNQGDNYCCLGVLCDIAVKSGLDVNVDTAYGVTHFDGRNGALPRKVQDWAGLNAIDPVVAGQHLASWNDDFDKSFDDIAKLIEDNL